MPKDYYLIWMYSVLRSFISKGYDTNGSVLPIYRNIRQEYEFRNGETPSNTKLYNFLKVFV